MIDAKTTPEERARDREYAERDKQHLGCCVDPCWYDYRLRLLAERDALEARAVAAEAEVARLREALRRDRTGLGAALAAIVREVNGRSWIMDGRGPYEWDDDRYKDEAGDALRKVLGLAEAALRQSGEVAQAALAKGGA